MQGWVVVVVMGGRSQYPLGLSEQSEGEEGYEGGGVMDSWIDGWID